MSILDFAKEHGIVLGLGQRIFLKSIYGIPFDDSEKITVFDPTKIFSKEMTEKEATEFISAVGFLRKQDGVESKTSVLNFKRRSGTTMMICLVLGYELKRLLDMDNPQEASRLPAHSILAALLSCPTTYQANMLLDNFKHIFRGYKWFLDHKDRENESSISFKTKNDISKGVKGSIILISKSSISKKLRGHNCFFAAIDEDTYHKNDKALFQAFYPSVSSFEHGKIMVVSTDWLPKNEFLSSLEMQDDVCEMEAYSAFMNPNSMRSEDILMEIKRNRKGFQLEFGY